MAKKQAAKKIVSGIDVKKGIPALDDAFLERVKHSIQLCWNYIADDALELDGRMSNSGAMELCLDANRLTTDAKAPEADKLIGEAITLHGYAKVSRFLCRNIQLV